jgi:putative peptidoglycan lipid II flippase
VLGISLATAIFPVLSAAAADNDQSLLTETIRRGIQAAFFVAMPATLGLILVARPLTALIYQQGEFASGDTLRVQKVLIFYSIGLCGFFLQQLVTRSFYSIKDSKWPARTAVIAVVINIILNLTLIWTLGVSGLALATAVCSYVQVVILLAILNHKFKLSLRQHLWPTLIKTIIGTLIMGLCGAACHYGMSRLPQNRMLDFLRVGLMVAICAGVYIVAARVLGNEMLGLLFKSRKNTSK